MSIQVKNIQSNYFFRDFLTVQWLDSMLTWQGCGFDTSWGTKIPHTMWHGQKFFFLTSFPI